MDFLVTPPDETEWRMDPADFEAALRERWPDAQVEPNPEHGLFAFDFTVSVEGARVDGGFARDGRMLAIGDEVLPTAHVAVWFRGLTPPEQALLFYDDGYAGHVELTPGMTAADLAAAYQASEAA